uniref:Protein THEM6 n=1 Tax=Megaselia scalaris TaxID=36166 RepID=T1GPB0_MEGSC
MNFWCIILLCVLSIIIVTYLLIELHYFVRMCLCVLNARFIKKKVDIFETTSVTGICLSSDVDTFLFHMNNARYFREIDFARADFYERTCLYKKILAKGGSVVQGASTIRYRKFIRPFSLFRITSKV